jgi:hypothetical protein
VFGGRSLLNKHPLEATPCNCPNSDKATDRKNDYRLKTGLFEKKESCTERLTFPKVFIFVRKLDEDPEARI